MEKQAEEVQMEQQTKSWAQFRRTRLGSSDAPVVMGVSPYSTPYKLWLEKSGKVELVRKSNYAIEIGNRFEAVARARYEIKTDLELPAAVLVHPRYPFIMASLDGYNKQASVVLEIKCFTSKTNFEIAKSGRVPEWYYPQLQHQLLVSGAKEVHFFCCQIAKVGLNEQVVDDALVVVQPDPEYQKQLLINLLGFKKFLDQDIAPPLTEDDWMECDDQSTVLLFSKIKPIKKELLRKEALIGKIKEEVLKLEEELALIREEAIEHVEALGHPRISAVGVKMAKNKAGVWSIRLATEGDNDAKKSS
jgi:putative phage-type endonuclease